MVIVVFGAALIGATLAVGWLRADPAPEVPDPKRVVKVNVRSGG